MLIVSDCFFLSKNNIGKNLIQNLQSQAVSYCSKVTNMAIVIKTLRTCGLLLYRAQQPTPLHQYKKLAF